MNEKEEKKEDQVSGDSVLAELLGKLSQEMKENPIKSEMDFEYPMEIAGIKKISKFDINNKETGKLVKVRPCGDEYKDKTYLGIYLGESAIDHNIALYEKTNILGITTMSNPAIFVPELKKVVYGCQSWWSRIESEDQLEEITDKDINDTWYVQLLRGMIEKDGKESENNKTSE